VNYFDNPHYSVMIVGAGRGIGRSAALELSAQGTLVACFDSDGASAHKVAEEIKARGGRSIAGKEGNAGMTAYSATKAGLIGMVKSMAKDYVEHGITINSLAPAVIRTAMVEALPQATVDYMTAKIPMRRCGELEEAAQMIAWIVSPACSFTTGFTFDLSGGRATY
jgi:NAD(P)-dependent dehydrogenase (short-subunit alcohol dehydrogenase family)